MEVRAKQRIQLWNGETGKVLHVVGNKANIMLDSGTRKYCDFDQIVDATDTVTPKEAQFLSAKEKLLAYKNKASKKTASGKQAWIVSEAKYSPEENAVIEKNVFWTHNGYAEAEAEFNKLADAGRSVILWYDDEAGTDTAPVLAETENYIKEWHKIDYDKPFPSEAVDELAEPSVQPWARDWKRQGSKKCSSFSVYAPGKVDEGKWDDAKAKVKSQRKKNIADFTDQDWGLVSTIYKNMGGTFKSKSSVTTAQECPNPGQKTRSQGQGQGWGRGKGRGPIGVPVGDKDKTKTYWSDELGNVTIPESDKEASKQVTAALSYTAEQLKFLLHWANADVNYGPFGLKEFAETEGTTKVLKTLSAEVRESDGESLKEDIDWDAMERVSEIRTDYNIISATDYQSGSRVYLLYGNDANANTAKAVLNVLSSNWDEKDFELLTGEKYKEGDEEYLQEMTGDVMDAENFKYIDPRDRQGHAFDFLGEEMFKDAEDNVYIVGSTAAAKKKAGLPKETDTRYAVADVLVPAIGTDASNQLHILDVVDKNYVVERRPMNGIEPDKDDKTYGIRFEIPIATLDKDSKWVKFSGKKTAMKSMDELKTLWEKLGDTPVNDDGEIDEKFLDFDIGTDREEIWTWFEEQNPDFSVAKMMYPGESASAGLDVESVTTADNHVTLAFADYDVTYDLGGNFVSAADKSGVPVGDDIFSSTLQKTFGKLIRSAGAVDIAAAVAMKRLQRKLSSVKTVSPLLTKIASIKKKAERLGNWEFDSHAPVWKMEAGDDGKKKLVRVKSNG